MGKLVFYYGTMGSAKTANALITRHQYLQNGRSVWRQVPDNEAVEIIFFPLVLPFLSV